MSKQLRGSLMLLLVAFIWGSAFVAQSEGMEYLSPLVYNSVRTVIGALVLLPVTLIYGRKIKKQMTAEQRREQVRVSVRGGIVIGALYCVSSALQQYGISMTTAGKAGFVSALYIILVPLFGYFFGRRVPPVTWVCVAVALGGFWLLCVNEGFRVSLGDFLVLLCAFTYSFHILAVDRYTSMGADCVLMSFIQFLTAAILVWIPTLFLEEISLPAIWAGKWTLLYAGVLSCGVAFTLQMVGQRDCPPAAATLLMSLESVFAALSGWVILHERLSGRELCGCALVFAAVLGAQLPVDAAIRKIRKKMRGKEQ